MNDINSVLENSIKCTNIEVRTLTGKGYTISKEYGGDYNTYNNNESFTVIIDPEGIMYTTPTRNDYIEMLDKNGYVKENIEIPFTKGELPIDKELANKLYKLQTAATVYKELQKKEDNLNKFNDLDEETMSSFMVATGLEITPLFAKKIVNYVITGASEKAGTYNQANGILAFKKDSETVYVGTDKQELVASLIAAGYEKSKMKVPFSFGEEIVDQTKAKEFSNLMKENVKTK